MLLSALLHRPCKAAGYTVPTATAPLRGLLHCLPCVAKLKEANNHRMADPALDNETLAERSCQLVANSLLLTKLDGRIRISRHLPTHKKPSRPQQPPLRSGSASNIAFPIETVLQPPHAFVVVALWSGRGLQRHQNMQKYLRGWMRVRRDGAPIHCYESRRTTCTTYTPSAINPTVPPP